MELVKLKDLAEGSGFEHIKTISHQMKVFCPFEAVGMVRQEIRHTNFLAYILDPNRPHGFGTLFLEAFITLLTNEAIPKSRMLRARVQRELMNIDLLIEIPPEDSGKGLVIAVEVKIDAGERRDQLRDYERRVQKRWPQSAAFFGFLTTDGRQGATSSGKFWRPIRWTDLIGVLDRALELEKLGASTPGLEMYTSYGCMMRRHGMVDKISSTPLDDAVAALWSQHREALEYIFENRPDPISGLMRRIRKNMDEMAKLLGAALGITAKPASSTATYLRFSFPELEARYPDLCKGRKQWAGDSASIILLEIYRTEYGITAAIVVGPADGAPELRRRLIEAMNLTDGGRRPSGSSGWSHNWLTTLGEIALIEAAVSEESLMQHFSNQIAETLHIVMHHDLPALLDQAISHRNS